MEENAFLVEDINNNVNNKTPNQQSFKYVQTSNNPLPNSKGVNILLSFLIIFGVSFMITIFIGNILFTPLTVVGMSMQPNLNTYVKEVAEDEKNDTVYIANYTDFDYGEIVVFKEKNQNIYLIKRVIGKPGDTISYKEIERKTEAGVEYIYYKIILNGYIIDEPYILEPMKISHTNLLYNDIITHKVITLSNSQYFCLGDNRNDSNDSRYLGPIEKNTIIGEVYFVVHYGDSLFKGLFQSFF